MAIVQEIKNGQVVDNSASQKKTDESTKIGRAHV